MKNQKLPTLTNCGFIFIFFMAFCFMVASSCNQGPPEGSKSAQADKGKAHFMKYCSSCHGEDGKGLRIDSLDVQPADLTKIMSSRKASTFPINKVANIIDGRQHLAAHGARAMPIWGEFFTTEEELSEKELKGTLGELIAFLMRIQE